MTQSPGPAADHGRFVVVPAAYVLLLRDGPTGTEVLLQLRSGVNFMDGHWASAAAGHVERGETAYDAAHREAAEELGITDLTGLSLLTTMQRTGSGEPVDERVDFFFTARGWQGEPRVMEPSKCGGLRWVPLDGAALDALPGPLVPHERAVLEMLVRGTSSPYTTFGFHGEHDSEEEIP